MTVAIHQPNFFPWIGYFLKIARSDVFVFLNDVKIQKSGSSFTNRVAVNVTGESKWITASIKKSHPECNINDVFFLNKDWRKSFIATIDTFYKKALFYKENRDFLLSLINCEIENLAKYNIYVVSAICNYLSIKLKAVNSSELTTTETSTERLIEIIKVLGGSTYLSGLGADKYQDTELYRLNNIGLIYNTFSYPDYQQINTKVFIPNLSIIDFLINQGKANVIEFIEKQKSISLEHLDF